MNTRWALFPYCMEQNDDGSWVFLNRKYKPIGMNTGEWIKYDDYPVRFFLKGLGPATRAKLDIHGKGTDRRIYFYNDATVPTKSAKNMKAYLARLEIIMNLQEGSK